MIPMNQEMFLGRKTLLLLVLRKTLPAFVILFLAAAILIFQSAASGITDQTTQSAISMSGTISAVAMALAVILFFIGFALARLQYSHYNFTLEEFSLKLKRGVLGQHETSIPYRSIQSVDVTRSLPYRLLGVSRLVIISAGHDDPGEKDETDTVFDPVDKDLAEEIREVLERHIGIQVIQGEQEADRQSGVTRV